MSSFQKQEYANWIHSEVATRREFPEVWRPIPGWEDRYKISTHGRVVNIQTGKEIQVKVNNDDGYQVRLYRNHKQSSYSFKRLMWRTFIGDVPNGYKVTSKASPNDLHLEDLTLITQSELASRAGRGNCKPVIKINPQGKVVKLYRTATEAGKDNCYAPITIIYRCSNKACQKPAADGCDYAYEDDPYSIRRALVRLGVDWREWDYDNSGQM